MSKRVIFHIDVNSAFLSWEAVYRLHHLGGTVDLRDEVCAVGGDIAMRHGIILAKSIPAKKYGIKTGESIIEALNKCPHLKVVPPNYHLYNQCSEAMMSILRSYSPCVEPFSIDEAFMDMTGLESLWGEPVEAAHRIRRRIKEELGFTVNIGISENKLLAKMAGDFEKPDKVHTLWKDEIAKKMWPLPVGDLIFVGRSSKKKLFSIGIHTIEELAHTDIGILKSHFKKHGETIWAYANGIDNSPVLDESPGNKGYGNSTTMAFDVNDAETAKKVLLGLSETIGTRLRNDEVRISEVSVAIKSFHLQRVSHQMQLVNSTNVTQEIYEAACQLFDELWDGTPIRLLGVHTGKITKGEEVRQIGLFDHMDYERQEQLDHAVDQIRKRFGRDAIKRAVFVESKIDHMSGGISREKRTVDYDQIEIE